MARETILLTRSEIARHVDIVQAIPAIEEAMGAFEKGEDYLPPKAIFEIPVGEKGGAYAACIVGFTQVTQLLSMKLGQERSLNHLKKLPTTNSWITVFDPDTGELLMICDGTLPTMYRTAAAAAVSAKHLARADAATLSVIGAGQLGRQCLRAVSSVRAFERILLYDINPTFANDTVQSLATDAGMTVEAVDAQTACSSADVLVTATNSRQPIVESAWIRPGTHLACMGTDLPDKIECEMDLLPRCKRFADQPEHALKRGEVSQAVTRGLLGQDCFEASLGQVINNTSPGRTQDDEITLFDGVGIGIQDTTIAKTIYDQARAKNAGVKIKFS